MKTDNFRKTTIITTVAGALVFAAAIFLDKSDITGSALLIGILYSLALIMIGGDVYIHAFRNIAKGDIFNEFFLMSLAVTGAFAISEYTEGISVMLFYKVGEILQDYAIEKSKKSINSIMDLRPDTARLKTQDGMKEISPSEINPGDLIVVMPGERIPLDGIVVEGSSSLDMSSLTGEAIPLPVASGNEILSGTVNIDGMLVINVSRIYSESTVSRILTIVEESAENKAKSEKHITKFAEWYTPIVVIIAVIIAFAPHLLFKEDFNEWLYRSLVFLVASCPCALVLSIPIGFFAGIGGASRRGVLIKGGNFVEALAKADTVVFDKTGTLTEGVFKVTDINPSGSFSGQTLLFMAAHAEMFSMHPLATPIINAYGDKLDSSLVTEFSEEAGKGVTAKVSGITVTVGNRKYAKNYIKEGINDLGGNEEVEMVSVLVVMDGVYAGEILLSDALRRDALSAVKRLRQLGIRLICMLTGDGSSYVHIVKQVLNLDCVHSGLLPYEKVEKLENIMLEKKTSGGTIYVGDGINDAPVLARSDVGVAMGGIGSDAAIEAADVVLMRDEPGLLAEAIIASRKTIRIIRQNIVFALIVKSVILVLGASGYAAMWTAVFADVGVAVLAVLNAMRSL